MKSYRKTSFTSLLRQLVSKRKVLCIFIVSTLGFLIAIASLKSIYLGDHFSDIPTGEFFLEKTVPITFWVGLILVVGSFLFMITLPEDESAPTLPLISCVFLVLCMRGILSITMSKPYAYDVVNHYVPWMKVWLDEGVQLIPGPSISMPLLYYYPNHHPLSFFIAYAFLKVGVPTDFFFMWARCAIYAVNVFLVYLVTKEISQAGTKVAAVSAFLFASSWSSTFLTMWYCPQLLGSTLFLLSILSIVKCSRMRKRSFPILCRTYALMCAVIFLLIITHHLSTLYLFATLTGLYLVGTFMERYGHVQGTLRVSIIWPTYTLVVWFVYAGLIYPHKLDDWVKNISLALRGNPLHAYQSVGFSNFLSMPITDQISFISYPLLIFGLVAYGLLKTPKKATNGLATTTLGLNSLLLGLLVLGLVAGGITYPIRVMEVMCILCSPLAAKSFIELFSTSVKKRLIIVVVMIVVVCLNTHWLFRVIQRTIPSWISESWLD